ncbi:MAG: ATP synthase F1 subunit delta [Paludibacter sp.]|jgi:F-type H+-transporting ATPase subunit delta|nr:ATP synthase F1 subunit delta [Paludibacter sp.]
MNVSFIPVRYATALYGFANQRDSDEIIYRQAIALSAILTKNKFIKAALANPVATQDIKQEILFSLLGVEIHPDLKQFITFLFDKKREIFVNEILCRYVGIFREKNNLHRGKLTTATAISSESEQKIASVISSKIDGKLEIESSIDPALIGGFVLEVDNLRCDASVKGKLQNIKKELS